MISFEPSRKGYLLVLLALSAALVLAFPSLFLKAALWDLPAKTIVVAISFAASYVVAIAVLLWHRPSGGKLTIIFLASLLALAYAPTFLTLLVAKTDFPRWLLAAELAAAAIGACAAILLYRFPKLQGLFLTVAAAIGIGLQISYGAGFLPRPIGPNVVVRSLNSSLYALKLTEYRSWIPTPTANGGGIVRVGDRYLLATGDGDLYWVAESEMDRALSVTRLAYRIPVNTSEFVTDAGGKVDTTLFRAADIAVEQNDGRLKLFASHHYWNKAAQCFVMRVSELQGPLESFVESRSGMVWKTIFESTPCVPIATAGQPPVFVGNEIGGRLAVLNSGELLVAIGDNGLDGWSAPMSLSQDMKSTYGKTVLINLHDYSSQIYSSGHRNPQGLYRDGSGAIWLTEHGPQGGDELNLIERGANYGFPLVTYGVQYGTHSWPFDPTPGSHEGFAQPFYSWIPSIGISSLLTSNGAQFQLWKNDLLISSLKNKTLYRIRVRENRVAMAELMKIGDRIRDMEQGASGELLLWTDSATLMFVRTAIDTDSGDALFDSCAGCHAVHDGQTHGIGPDLYQVVDRKVAAAKGFKYSPAMQNFQGTWTKERLDRFLSNPQSVVPGTAMQFAGISEATTRARLIEFLAAKKKRSLGEYVVTD